MKTPMHFFILCLLALCFTLSVMAQKVSPLKNLFPQNSFQDTLYNITPTENGQLGYHLWIWKPSFESKMPLMKNEKYMNKDMNLNPLKQAPDQELK